MEPSHTIPEVDPHEAQRRIEAGALHVDVRERDEHTRVRIPGGVLVPLSEFMERYEAELPRDREIVVSCRSGARSGRATLLLREQGFDAINLGGGILAWQEEGLPVEEG
jgi:rhodanese-related sulfurtransferase